MRHLCHLPIFVGLVLPVYVQCQTICRKDQYTVVKSDGSKSCLNCDTCHAGFGLYPRCGRHIPYPPKIDCVACPAGEFSDTLDSAPCHSCQRCAEHEIVTAPCTSQSNRICNGTCEAGYFYSRKDSTHSCKKCSYCCLDGKDEEIPECANQGLEASKQRCRPRPDKDCSPGSSLALPTDHLGGTEAPENGGLSSSIIVVIVVGVVIAAVIIALAIGLCLHRRRKKQEDQEAHSDMNHQSSAQSYARNGPAIELTAEINNPPDTQSNTLAGSQEGYTSAGSQEGYTSAGSQEGHTSAGSQEGHTSAGSQEGHDAGTVTVEGQYISGAISGDNLYTANEQAHQNATHRSLPNGNNSEPDAASVNLIAAKDNTSDRKSGGDPTVLPVVTEAAPALADKEHVKNEAAASGLKDKTSGNPIRKLSRQFSKDSQRSGGSADAESGRWKRSPSTSSFTETLKRKLSKKDDDSLVANEEQDTDGVQEAIKIIEEPSSQEKKERSKVELVFKCGARENSKLSYQWYKDGTKLPGKDEGTLVLKSVTLPDFGSYKCVAICKDSSVSVESSPAELDVIPRDGTMYKYLKNIDINTQDRIEGLLTQKSYGLGGWRQIAFKYGMGHLKIKSLENDQEAGKKTLEYLGASNPDLTVYEFCKTLKEHDIRRLDIVKELLGHLSVPSSSKVYV